MKIDPTIYLLYGCLICFLALGFAASFRNRGPDKQRNWARRLFVIEVLFAVGIAAITASDMSTFLTLIIVLLSIALLLYPLRLLRAKMLNWMQNRFLTKQ